MPPKKEETTERLGAWALGRFSNRLKVGIVGLPNVGKSTLYNTLTKCAIPAENFPFCTIDPNETRVNVPDERFDWLVKTYTPQAPDSHCKSIVHPWLEICDIAGLVKGAAQGAGLGNAFLSHIRAVDGIMHVLRAFEDPDIVHVEDKVDPIRDIEIITAELREKDKAKANSNAATKKEWQAEVDTANKVLQWLAEGKEVRLGVGVGDADYWTTKDIQFLNDWMLLTAKPALFLVNLSEEDYKRKKNKFLKPIHDWVQSHGGGTIIPYSDSKENEVPSALPKIIKTAFAMCHLIYYDERGSDCAGPEEFKRWEFDAGEYITHRGDTEASIFFIVSGSVACM
ncbi:hypothetical protein GUITHDRAFT_159055 [Guillardia theta CCMP2712]|uniref:OBG-type G domain-containing protein n=1 Tax=Guillardia theta (strain CCMP2712) TaxID=905079 RepID=L1I5H8_GUITC|nr:hypothetical protein GUITHDRAFT_159055 [Guillardia theta CCMP2712]EKX31322.1 hypothetical protein GUITHDRAFT_159055 [Guillardia theta CCMP2712]|eukprot:XP_005818302.1 hypothetical protein GUITHDRAFT_159055 [Guillardia theta CCMP2712]